MMDAAKDLVSGGMDAVKEGVAAAADGIQDAVANLDPKKKLLKDLKDKIGEQAGPLTELQGKLGSLTSSMDGLSGIGSMGSSLQSDFIDQFKKIGDGGASELGIPSSAACVAGMWVNSIKKNMEGIAKEVDTTIVSKVTGSQGLLDEFKTRIEGAVSGLEALVKFPDRLKDIEFSPEGLSAFEATLNETIKSSESALTEAGKALTETVKELADNCGGFVDGFGTFMSKAPSKVGKAFKAPCPCCCLSGVKAVKEKSDSLTDTLQSAAEKVEPVMKTISSSVGSLQETSKGIEIDPAMIKPFTKQIQDALNTVKEFMAKVPTSASDLRQCGSAEDEPAAVDAEA